VFSKLADFSPPAHPRRVFFALPQKATPPGSKYAVPTAPVSAPVTKIPGRQKPNKIRAAGM